VHAVRRHAVHISSDREPRRHAVAVGRIVPADIIVVVAPTAWPVVIAIRSIGSVGPVGSVRSVGPVGATIAGPARKAVVDADAAAKSRSGPVIATASGWPMMKAVIYASAAAKPAATATEAAAATATPAPRRSDRWLKPARLRSAHLARDT
jgi:hypothetical protein